MSKVLGLCKTNNSQQHFYCFLGIICQKILWYLKMLNNQNLDQEYLVQSWSKDSQLTFHFLKKILTNHMVVSWSKVSQIMVKVTHCLKLVNWLTCWSNLSLLTIEQHENTWPRYSLVMNCGLREPKMWGFTWFHIISLL